MISAASLLRARTLARVLLAAMILLPRAGFAASAPSITTQPHSQSVLAGSNAVFTVVASGTAPLVYQWSFNGLNLTNSAHIGGAKSARLTVTNVIAGDAGNYRVVVTNHQGRAVSSVATLTVLFPPGITAQPTNQTVYVGGSAAFSVVAAGTATLHYRWLFGGTSLGDNSQITGSATNVLHIANVQPANVGDYQVVVTNNYGAITSAVAALNATNRFHYVNLNNPSPALPYTGWTTAATNIQDAIDAAVPGDPIFVTNGIYRFGNRVTSVTTNCVAAVIPVSIISISGAARTIINGGGMKRCLYLTN